MTKARQPVTAHQRFEERRGEFAGLPLDQRFSRIHETNLWGSQESVSGLGSALDETATLRQEIPALLRRLGATSLLDIPCGDFGWLSHAELDLDYTGADIVQEIVGRNRSIHTGPRRSFLRLDLTRDPLPRTDVVLCRDCLVHLSFVNILSAFRNLRRSGSIWLLTTTFLESEENADIEDGDWRMLNLERAPFHLPPPEAVIVEGCTESGGSYADKALGLWPIAALPE